MNDSVFVQALEGMGDVEDDLLDDVRPERPIRRGHPECSDVGAQGLKNQAQVETSGTLDLKIVLNLSDVRD